MKRHACFCAFVDVMCLNLWMSISHANVHIQSMTFALNSNMSCLTYFFIWSQHITPLRSMKIQTTSRPCTHTHSHTHNIHNTYTHAKHTYMRRLLYSCVLQLEYIETWSFHKRNPSFHKLNPNLAFLSRQRWIVWSREFRILQRFKRLSCESSVCTWIARVVYDRVLKEYCGVMSWWCCCPLSESYASSSSQGMRDCVYVCVCVYAHSCKIVPLLSDLLWAY